MVLPGIFQFVILSCLLFLANITKQKDKIDYCFVQWLFISHWFRKHSDKGCAFIRIPAKPV